MAVTAFGTNDAQTIKLWSTLTLREALKATLIYKLMGADKTAVIQKLVELEKIAGDQIKYDLLIQMSGPGATSDNRMKDNEESLAYYQDSVSIDQLRHGHAFRRMSQQRTNHELRMDGKTNLADWWANTLDTYAFRALCGDTSFTFANAGTAPTSNHVLFSGDATSDATIGNNDQITLADIDFCKEKATTLSPIIKPTVVNGEKMFIVVLDPFCITDLRLDTAASAYIAWPDIVLNAVERGKDHPYFTGALGVYNNCILFESTRLFSPATSVKRNLFLGAQAGTFAMGGAYDSLETTRVGKDNLMSWYEEVDDYGNEKGCSCGAIFGIKKNVFNSEDHAVITVSSYSAQH